MDNFLKRAAELGQDAQKLKNGQTIDQIIKVDSLTKLKSLLNDGSPAKVSKTKPTIAAKNASLSIAEKVHDHIFFDSPLTDSDMTHLKSIFPVDVRTISAENKTLQPGEVWDLGTSTNPVIVNLGTLTMQPGSSIKIANAVIDMVVDTLVMNSGSLTAPYDLGIFGVTGIKPPQAEPIKDADNGAEGSGGTCGPGGGVPGDNGGTGKTGQTGYDGNTGIVGGNGFPSLTSIIKLGNITGNFRISTCSGNGGQGGQGGVGGNGGVGGKGGKGATCGCTNTNGGAGGNGGNSGNGGIGGKGGDATDGNNIYVIIPKGQTGKIIQINATANGGAGGIGGPAGKPGAKGVGGKGGGASGCPSGSTGSNGKDGQNTGITGSNGTTSTKTGAPGTFYIIEEA
jgi:hypothetical protein